MQFDNTPPEGEPKLATIPYRTGRDGVYRTAGDKVLAASSRRGYGDVQNETANYLTNTPNYRAYCKFIEGDALTEHCVATRRVDTAADRTTAERITNNSRRLARPRAEVEARVVRLWSSEVSESDAYVEGSGRKPMARPVTNGRTR